MPKATLSMFGNRRKSSIGNAFEEAQHVTTPEPAPAAAANDGGFRVMDQAEIARRKAERAQEAEAHKKSGRFGRFSGFGTSNNKARNQSFDEDSLSSKRDSKSSNGTHSSRPYGIGHHGSTSTLPSSADTDPSDNMFSNMPPRPHYPQHNSSPNSLSMGAMRKDLPPPPPKSKTDDFAYPQNSYSSPYTSNTPSRARAMTTSSYASTAIPPKLDGGLDFGSSNFDDMFTGIDRKESPEQHHDSPSAGRSLLAGKRAFQAEPINIQSSKLAVEPPLKSWDSRGSNEHLIASPTEDTHSSPPPVPPHKYAGGKYAPVASHSPEMRDSDGYEDADARMVRQSFVARKSINGHPAEQNQISNSSSATSLQTPLSSQSGSNNATPRAPLPVSSPLSEDDDDNMFASAKATPVRKPAAPLAKENIPPPPPIPGERRVMTAAEFKAQQAQQTSQPEEDSSDSDDYEDEEEAIAKREQEEIAFRKRQQMSMARDVMRRTTTAPADPNRPPSRAGTPSMGFPPDISLVNEDEDDEVPLGILMHHGFPKQGKPPSQMANAHPSYFRSNSPAPPERPASAGALGNRQSNGYRPPFARGLPEDPHASFIGGGLVRQPLRETMGFNRGPASVYGEPTGPSVPMFPYHEPQQQTLSLIDQVQLREQAKPKYMGGASGKQPQGGPFTGALGNQMNGMNANSGRMPNMPMQPGMMGGMGGMGGMNPMMNGMGGMNPTVMAGQMPMMGMNPNGYPFQQNQLMEYQQMLAMQMQFAQMQAMMAQQQQGGQQGQPGMGQPNFGVQNNQFLNPNSGAGMNGSNGFLSVGTPGAHGNNRPMSVMSHQSAMTAGQGLRPHSTPTHLGVSQVPNGFQQLGGPGPGYTPSIAPSERSNIGLSARYRPVVTPNGTQDGISTVSSATLQASGGNEQRKTVKGILKSPKTATMVNQVQVREDDEDWGSMRDRKNKFTSGEKQQNPLSDLVF